MREERRGEGMREEEEKGEGEMGRSLIMQGPEGRG